MSGEVVTDTTGLHSYECECIRCDGGYRPTEEERSLARRALAVRRAREVAALAVPPAVRGVPRMVRPLTTEEWEDLGRERKRLFERVRNGK